MSRNSVVGKAYHAVSGGDNSFLNHPAEVFGGNNSVFNNPGQLFGGQGGPTPAAPPNAPNPNAATQTAVQNQVTNEAQARGSQALVTGGMGVMQDPTVKTASQMLMGS